MSVKYYKHYDHLNLISISVTMANRSGSRQALRSCWCLTCRIYDLMDRSPQFLGKCISVKLFNSKIIRNRNTLISIFIQSHDIITHQTIQALQVQNNLCRTPCKPFFIQTRIYPDYSKKLEALDFYKQMIIENPKAFVNIFESSELHQQLNFDTFLQAWSYAGDIVIQIFKEVPINATFVFKDANFVVNLDLNGKKSGYQNANCVQYMIIKIFWFLNENSKTKDSIVKQEDQNEKAKLVSREKKIMQIISKLYVIYHYFMKNCCVQLKTLKLITQLLCTKFYSSTLTIKMLQVSFNMLSQLGDPAICEKNTGNIQPFLYFDGKAKIGLRLLLANNKWPFNKGMHLCVWMKSFTEYQNPNHYIVFLKVDDKNSFILKQERSEIVVESLVSGEKNKRKVCDLPIKKLTKLEVALEPKDSGIFKSSVQYRLHIRINGDETKNVEIKLPKFDSSDFVTQFNMFGEFVGQFYSLGLWKSIHSYSSLKDKLPDTLASEQEVTTFLQNSQNSEKEILTLLTPLRVYKGILINMINSEDNHACHEATMLLNQTQNKVNQFLTSFSQIILPYLYLTAKLWRDSHQQSCVSKAEQIKEEQKFECEKFMKTLIQQYCKARQSYCQQTSTSNLTSTIKNNLLQNYQTTILYILYWLEVTLYPIDEITLSCLLDLTFTNEQNYQPLFYKYIDRGILTSKNCNIELIVKKISSKSTNNEGLNKFSEFDSKQPCDPIAKLQLLFFLQTSWKELWNRYQYMTEWWYPLNLQMQNDEPFNHGNFQFKKEAEEGHEIQKRAGFPFIEWVVSEFITNDFCDCLIVPLILDPTYRKLGEQTKEKQSPFVFNHYRQQYSKKQCMTEKFNEPSLIETILNKSEPKSFIFKKKTQSLLNMFMNKVHKKEPTQIVQASNKSSRTIVISKGEESQRYETEASYLNLLTLIIGTLCIQIRGKSVYIYFCQKHDSKSLDHMCVKGYRNEEFIYICIDLDEVRVVKRRRFNQSMNGMEIRLKSGHGYLFYFHEKNIDKFIAFLNQNTKKNKNRIDLVFKDPYDQYLKSNQTTQWIDKKISNWEYLQWLNDIAGRSYNDITQYPVLPWVFIEDIKHPQTSIVNDASFRDLFKNMGSFGNEERINHFIDKYENVGEQEIFSEYHFGTHYSSSAIIFNYLIRLRPFSVGAVTLQSGRFDCADRVFSSYIGSWINATNSPTDLRQLIPEIYMLPQMMININGYDFGLTQLKQRICNVQLPQWSNKNPYVFCKNLRKALQSENVNKKINHWIDLIYGYKQQGPAAIESMNIFFPLTYENGINVDKISDPDQKISIQTQIAHFGQNPAQIIGRSPHPLRSTLKQKWQNKLIADCNDTVIQKCSLTRMNTGQVKFIFQSVFEDKNSILAIKFMTDNVFLVLRRYQFCLFKILDNKSGFISKQKQIQFVTEQDNISLDYQNIATYVPMITVLHKNTTQQKKQHESLSGVSSLAIVGGFYNGVLQIIYLNDVKSSGTLRMPFETVTSLAYSQDYQFVYIGDCKGYLGVYKLKINSSSSSSKQLELVERYRQQVHDLKINNLSINKTANLFLTASQDGTIKLFNLFSQQQYRKIYNPSKYPVVFARISTCPLYCIVFYSEQNSTFYSYSINGQFLASFQDATGFVYNMSVLMNTGRSQNLVYLNAQREIFILELPQLKSKKRIRLKKDEYKISCLEMTNQIAIAGSQDGALQIIADPSSF